MTSHTVSDMSAARSSETVQSSPTKMGSVKLPASQANPWIETPLVESSALSKAAGWYAHKLWLEALY